MRSSKDKVSARARGVSIGSRDLAGPLSILFRLGWEGFGLGWEVLGWGGKVLGWGGKVF